MRTRLIDELPTSSTPEAPSLSPRFRPLHPPEEPLTSLVEIEPPHTGLAFPAMASLRPVLADEAAFVHRVDEVQRREGYRLVGAFDPAWSHAAAVAGFRVAHSISWGHYLYIDDLATLPPARRRGHGGRLLAWLMDEGRRLGCDQLHLDSGVGSGRFDAHRLYLNAGMPITAYHFACGLAGED